MILLFVFWLSAHAFPPPYGETVLVSHEGQTCFGKLKACKTTGRLKWLLQAPFGDTKVVKYKEILFYSVMPESPKSDNSPEMERGSK